MEIYAARDAQCVSQIWPGHVMASLKDTDT